MRTGDSGGGEPTGGGPHCDHLVDDRAVNRYACSMANGVPTTGAWMAGVFFAECALGLVGCGWMGNFHESPPNDNQQLTAPPEITGNLTVKVTPPLGLADNICKLEITAKTPSATAPVIMPLKDGYMKRGYTLTTSLRPATYTFMVTGCRNQFPPASAEIVVARNTHVHIEYKEDFARAGRYDAADGSDTAFIAVAMPDSERRARATPRRAAPANPGEGCVKDGQRMYANTNCCSPYWYKDTNRDIDVCGPIP